MNDWIIAIGSESAGGIVDRNLELLKGTVTARGTGESVWRDSRRIT